MSCKCATYDEDDGRYSCSVSGDGCMYMSPDSKRCAKDYGEGPDTVDADAMNEKLKLINSMEVVDFSASGDEMEYVLVDDNQANREILHQIGITEDEIIDECYPEDGQLDIASVGFKYADMWSKGKGFYSK